MATFRRFLLRLVHFFQPHRAESELERELAAHLGVLEDAQLIVTRKSGREKLHYLNPVPIRLIHDRWIDKYTERRVSALTQLKSSLEKAR